MSPNDYSTLTGISVSNSRAALIMAQVDRSRTILESLLGFALDPDLVNQNLYSELGKSQTEFSCPDTTNLLPKDPVVGAYRLYSYNEKDRYIAIDPFSTIHAVKLVHGGVTVYTFPTSYYRPEVGRGGLAKYIELQPLWYRYFDVLWFQRAYPLGYCQCGQRWQYAIDADWLWEEDLPMDIQYVWADMVTYYANQKRELKSETVGSHSYSQGLTVPQDRPENLAILNRYAGPYGSLTHSVVA